MCFNIQNNWTILCNGMN
uniref:Uncharacterized protein n=1 Tax=Rhizophora mucronata TaxID=61149 RepID=A0A2P2PKZ0_RHIMU